MQKTCLGGILVGELHAIGSTALLHGKCLFLRSKDSSLILLCSNQGVRLLTHLQLEISFGALIHYNLV